MIKVIIADWMCHIDNQKKSQQRKGSIGAPKTMAVSSTTTGVLFESQLALGAAVEVQEASVKVKDEAVKR